MYVEYFIALLIVSAVAWAMIFTKGNHVIKAIFIVALITSSVYTFKKIEQYQGTPRPVSDIPADMVVYGYKVREGMGRINLYFVKTSSMLDEPTSICCEYTREMHKGLQEATKQFKGKPFRMKSKAKGGSAEGEHGEGNGEGETDNDGIASGSISLKSEATIEITGLPSGSLPEKLRGP